MRLENWEVVLGKYSGGWKMQWDDPKPSGPAIIFQFIDRWMSGVIHGEGTFEFTTDEDVFWGMCEGDVYKGYWDNNVSHGQGLLAWG